MRGAAREAGDCRQDRGQGTPAGSGPGPWPLAILSRAGRLCSGPCPPPGPRRPHEEPSVSLAILLSRPSTGGRGLALRAASGLEDQVVWLIRKRVCMCVCVHVCVCSWNVPAPVSTQGWWEGGLAECLFLCAAGHPACPQSAGPRPHLAWPLPSPCAAPCSSPLGSAWLHHCPHFLGLLCGWRVVSGPEPVAP